MQEISEIHLSDLSLFKTNSELSRELEILETAFNEMKYIKNTVWKNINPTNGSELVKNGFFDHLCNKEHEKKLKKLYSGKINMDKTIPQTTKGKALAHDLIFSLVFLKELKKTEDIVLEPKYISLVDEKYENSPDMVVKDGLKYSIEIKMSKKGAFRKAPKQIKNSFEYDDCDFGFCVFPDKKITKIGRINKNLHSLCFLPEENYLELENIGLEKDKEKQGVVQINYLNIKEFLNDFKENKLC